MDVDSYISKYRPDWDRLEALTSTTLRNRSGTEIDEVVALYLKASAHLAEVNARFSDRALRDYLSRVVSRAHQAIYATRPRTVRGFTTLFGVSYRKAIRSTGPFIAAAAGILVAFTAATLLWVMTSRAARAGLIPPAAQEAIREAEGGRADFDINPSAVSTFILVNNVRVAILAFALGIGFGVGTVYVLVQNAFLIGALAGTFGALGRGGRFWALVLPHGLLELTAICIAAGAGLRMGWSLVDPGDRPRGRALAEDAREAVMVLVGVVPAFVVAALIEGFVTGTSIPDAIELGIGVLVAVGYVAFLAGVPRRRRRLPARDVPPP